jgi:hypothetical protein
MISYTITACNEDKELNTLLEFLIRNIKESDEIVIQLDSESVTDEVKSVVERYKNLNGSIKVIEFPLNKDFASFKNNLKSHCDKEWIFNIDADEMPSGFLLDNLHLIVETNSEVEVFIVPRWNTVDGITDLHIKSWGWNFDEFGRVNWPDWQMRLYKNNDSIVWKNKVHEQLDGFVSYSFFPDEKEYCLFHNKTIQRQESQNNFYNTIGN